MNLNDGQIRVGTCSWQEPTLIRGGGFYPPGMPPAAMITHYAVWFDVVEVDSSYYRFLSRRTFEKWSERTPQGFVFNVKVPGIFTQQGMSLNGLPKDVQDDLDSETKKKPRIYLYHMQDEAIGKLWADFSESIEPLGDTGKLGSLLFQFPPYFRFGSKAREYLLECKERLPDHLLAVEFRASDWFRDPKTGKDRNEETLSFLEDNKLAYVAVDEPQGTKSSVPPLFAATHPNYAIVRFHGRKVQNWEKNVKPHLKFDWDYSGAELKPWVAQISGAAEEGQEVHAMFNTNNGNQGVVNSLKLKLQLGQITQEQYDSANQAIHAAMRERAVLDAGRGRRRGGN